MDHDLVQFILDNLAKLSARDLERLHAFTGYELQERDLSPAAPQPKLFEVAA